MVQQTIQQRLAEFRDKGLRARIGNRIKKHKGGKRSVKSIEVKIGNRWFNANHKRARALIHRDEDNYYERWVIGKGPIDGYIIRWGIKEDGSWGGTLVQLAPEKTESFEAASKRLELLATEEYGFNTNVKNGFYSDFDTRENLIYYYTNPKQPNSWVFLTESDSYIVHPLTREEARAWNVRMRGNVNYNPHRDQEMIDIAYGNREAFLNQARKRFVKKTVIHAGNMILRDTRTAPRFRSHILGEIENGLESECVPDIIASCIGSEKDGKRVPINTNARNNLRAEMAEVYGAGETSLTGMMETVRLYDLTTFVFNAEMKLIWKYVSDNRHFLLPCICVVHNEHVYPITNMKVIDKVMSGIEEGDVLGSVLMLPRFDDNEVYRGEMVEGVNMHVSDADVFRGLVKEYLSGGNIPGCVRADDRGGLLAYFDEINGCNVIMNPYCEYLEEVGDVAMDLMKHEEIFSEDVSWEWEGEDVGGYVEKLIGLLEGSFDCYKGLLDPKQYDRLFKRTMCPVKFMRRDAEDATRAYDVNGAYRYAVSKGEKLEAGIFDIYCDWEKFNGQAIVNTAQYLVRRIDLGWARWDNICISGETLRWGLVKGYLGQEDIREFCIPARKMNFGAWKKCNSLVDKLFSDVEDMKVRKKLVKMPINKYVGKCGMWETKKRTNVLGSVLDGLEGFNECISFGSKYGIDNVVMGQMIERKRMDRTSRAVHMAVIEFNIRRMDGIVKFIEKKGGQIYGIKTDCVYTNIELPARMLGSTDGLMKEEALSICGYRDDYFYKKYVVQEPWDVMEEETMKSGDVKLDTGNIVIDALAGYGKTYCVRKWLERTEERVVITSCANKPLTNYRKSEKVDVMNTTMLFTCNFGGIEKRLDEIAKKYDVLVLDEFSMTSPEHIEYGYLLKKRGMRLIFLGSGFQLGNVEGRYIRYGADKDIFKLMFDRYISLEWHSECRTDMAMDRFLKHFRETGEIKMGEVQVFEGELDTSAVHLVYTNKERERINSLLAPDGMTNGCPIVCKKNYRNLGVFNNMTGYFWDGKYIFGDIVVEENIEVELGYALTVHSAQGQTLDKVVVHQCHHRMVNANWMNVCISRVSSLDKIWFVGMKKDLKLEFQEEDRNVFYWKKWYQNGIIYLLKRGGEVFYVGSTSDAKERILAHRERFGDDIEMVELASYLFLTRNELLRREYFYIEKYLRMGFELENVKKLKPVVGFLESKLRKYILPYVYKKSLEGDRFVIKESVLVTDVNGLDKFIWKNLYLKKKPKRMDKEEWQNVMKEMDSFFVGCKADVVERIDLRKKDEGLLVRKQEVMKEIRIVSKKKKSLKYKKSRISRCLGRRIGMWKDIIGFI